MSLPKCHLCHCVVPENIHTPCTPTEGNGNSERIGGLKGGNPRGLGVAYRGFFPGDLSKIGELFNK